MESLTLQPIARVDGTINLPGSKSVSNRALLLAALANGTTVLTNLLDSDDVRHMLNALKALGVHYTLSDDRTRCEVTGNGGALQTGEELELFLGNAGTAMRPLAAALCLGRNNIVLTGEPRMKERPIGHLVDALRQGGAQIEYLEQENYPPLRLRGGFTGGHVEVDGSVSSQFLTALLMTAPLAPQDTVITIKGELVSKPYIDITLHLIKTFGVEVENQSYQRFVVRGAQQYQSPGSYLVEGDASSASYFLAAGAIKGGTVKVTGIGRNSVQGDIRFADVLEKMGAIVTWGDDFISCTHGELKAIDMDMNHIPDAAMTIATAALFAKGTHLYDGTPLGFDEAGSTSDVITSTNIVAKTTVEKPQKVAVGGGLVWFQRTTQVAAGSQQVYHKCHYAARVGDFVATLDVNVPGSRAQADEWFQKLIAAGVRDSK